MVPISPDTLALQRLYAWEKKAPDKVVLTQPLGSGQLQEYTWAQVLDQVRRMAAHLQAQGWEPGSRVAILSKNCAWWMMSDLAIWMAGHVSVPLYPTLAHDTVAHILEHSEARACFVGKLDDWPSMKAGVPADLPCISYPLSPPDARARCDSWDAICARTAPLPGEVVRGADELATLIYTSGTTGQPKGVMHSFGNLAWAIDTGAKRVTLGPEDRMLSYLPLAHVVERVLVEHGWLYAGLRVYFADSIDTFTADLQRARPTIFFSVPRLWVKFQQGILQKMPAARLRLLLSIPFVGALVQHKIQKALGLDACRFAVGGAAPMPLALLQWYSRLGLDIGEGYGMTENLAISHLTVPGQNQQGSVGPVYDGVEQRIDPHSGEIQMRNPALMLGYYKDPEKTREAFTADGWLRTGDEGRIDAQGCLHITGRLKDLFKTDKGKYVAPAPIEDQLGTHSAVEACVVAGANLSRPLGLVMLSAAAAERAAQAEGRAALQASLAEHLADINRPLDPHEQLSCIVVVHQPWTVENDLITPTFKVKRNRIDQLYGVHYARWQALGQPVVWADL